MKKFKMKKDRPVKNNGSTVIKQGKEETPLSKNSRVTGVIKDEK